MLVLEAEERLAKGCLVKLKGLKRFPEDNGKEATVTGFDEAKERYIVELPRGAQKLKRENLEVISVPVPAPTSPLAAPKAAVADPAPPTSGSAKQDGSDRRKKSRSRGRSRSRGKKTSPGSHRGKSRSRSRSRSRGTRRVEAASGAGSGAVVAGRGAAGGGVSFGGRGKGGGKGKEVQISKALSRVLRHTASSLGLSIRADGFCDVRELLSVREFQDLGCSFADLEAIVKGNDKARFQLIEENSQTQGKRHVIRAVQGHSMKEVQDDKALRPMKVSDPDLPAICVHGTYLRHLQSIKEKGLIAGGGTSNRNHVHFAPFAPGDGRVISGMRYNCEVAIFLDLPRALTGGVPFFRSSNDVLLSPGINGVIPFQFVKEVQQL